MTAMVAPLKVERTKGPTLQSTGLAPRCAFQQPFKRRAPIFPIV